MDKVAAYLGFAQKAQKLVSGDSAVEALLAKGKVKLIIMAKDASERVKRSFHNRADEIDVPVLFYGSKIDLGKYIGKSPRAVLAVTDQKFSEAILEVVDNHKD